jgi:NAD dependent epimerase/dehydratase family enzyme
VATATGFMGERLREVALAHDHQMTRLVLRLS